MRRAGLEDLALPLTLVFAVVFTLTVRQELSFSPTEAIAAAQEPDYVMTVTAKRLPAECRNPATRTSACDSLLAGDVRMEVREGGPRLARAQGGVFPY